MSSIKILVAQGGGPTAVINQSLAGVVLEARRFAQVERVYGALHGVRGIVDEELVDLGQETLHNLELVARTPASALGSTRDKPDLDYCQRILAMPNKRYVKRAVTFLDAEEIAALKGKGVSFEHYELPGTTLDGDVHVMGDMKAAWFKDPDGNILSVLEQD